MNTKMSPTPYICYHKHDHMSNLISPDSETRPIEYIERCVELGCDTYYINNHGLVGDIFEAKMLCDQYNLRCHVAMEGYIVPNPLEKDKSNYHIMLIPRTNKGRRLMNYASSRANTEGYYYKPRLFLEDLLAIDPEDMYVSTSCFTKGNRVLTNKGYVNIENIKKGDLVKNKIGEYEKVNYPTKIKYSGKFYTLRCTGFPDPIVCTEDHMFLTITPNSLYKKDLPVWRTAKEIVNYSSGSTKPHLLYPVKDSYSGLKEIYKKEYDGCYKEIEHPWTVKQSTKERIILTPKLMRFFGFFIGDGCITLKKNPRVCVTINYNEYKYYKKDFIDAVETSLGIKFSVTKRKENCRVDITASSLDLINLFYYLFGDCKAETKHIPRRLVHISKEFDLELFYGLLLSDGYVKKTKREKYISGKFTFCTTSHILAEQLQDLMSTLEIASSGYSAKEYLDKNGVHHKKAYYIESSAKIFSKIKKKSYMPHNKLKKIFRDLYKNSNANPIITLGGIKYKKVFVKEASVKRSVKTVYCLNNNSHSFIVNGAIVHNCMAGILSDDRAIKEIFMPLYEHFKDSMLLEVQSHKHPKQIEINQIALRLHQQLRLRLIAATDSHYVNEAGRLRRLELLKGKGITYGDEDTFILDVPDGDTLLQRFIDQGVLTESKAREAIENTNILRECEDLDINTDIKMPTIYPELTPKERLAELKKLVAKKFKEIMVEEGRSQEEIEERKKSLQYEMKIIEDTNEEVHSADYLLFNSKMVDIAVNKYHGVLTRGGRGSCASFYMNRVLGISQIDRHDVNLPIFPDRFASTARLLEAKSMPDIDFNVADQEPFVRACRDLLGEHQVYAMYAPGTMQLSEAFRNVCRSHKLQHDEYNEVGKNIEQYENNPKWKPLIDEAKQYVGCIISGSIHPCAYLLDTDDIRYEYGITKLGDHYCVLLTSYEADQFRHLKNDLLFVTVWKLISETFELAGEPIMPARELLAKIKDDDKVWKLIADGICCTLNQIDSDNGTAQAKRYGIKSFEDGALIAAAIRPSFDSWREQFLNHEEYSTGSEELDNVLTSGSVRGYVLFQENLLQYFNWLGVSPAEGITLIKKIAKKKIKPDDFKNLEGRLKENWKKNTGSYDNFDHTWKMIQSCMSYGFASPHAAATSLDMCYGAWLKVHRTLPYYTTCFNHYSGDQAKTTKLTKELDYFGVKLEGVKFRKSRGKYSFNKETNSIIKGISSIKYISDQIAEELYALKDSEYPHFAYLLKDIDEKTSVDSRQREILTRINYFSEFGKNAKLLKIIDLYDNIGKRKTLKRTDLDKFNIPEEVAQKYAGTITEKQFKDLDNIGMIIELSKNIEDKSIPIRLQIQSEIETLGAANFCSSEINERYWIIIEYKTYGSNSTRPYVTVRNLNNGEEIKTKVTSSKQYQSSPFGLYSVLRIDAFAERPKKRNVNGQWVDDPVEKELIISSYETIVK